MSIGTITARRSLAVICVVGLVAVARSGGSSSLRAQDNKVAEKAEVSVEGSWHNVGTMNPASGKHEAFPPGQEQIKLIAGGRWAWIGVVSDRSVMSMGGTYTVKDGVYTEKVTFIPDDRYKASLGKSYAYPLATKDGLWRLKGEFQQEDGRQSSTDELWERYPTKPAAPPL
jgi:hypothetical protein